MNINPAQDAHIMPSANRSEKEGNVSSIQSLVLRVQSLTTSIDRWNRVMLWGLALATVAALLIGIATRLVVVRSKQLTLAQGDLDGAKEAQLSLDLKDKDRQIAEVQRGAKEADARIAEAQRGAEEARTTAKGFESKISDALRDAAKANETAERERLARIQLESKLADRVIDRDTGDKMVSILRQHAGHKIQIMWFNESIELGNLGKQVWQIMLASGWFVFPAPVKRGAARIDSGSCFSAPRQTNVSAETLRDLQESLRMVIPDFRPCDADGGLLPFATFTDSSGHALQAKDVSPLDVINVWIGPKP